MKKFWKNTQKNKNRGYSKGRNCMNATVKMFKKYSAPVDGFK